MDWKSLFFSADGRIGRQSYWIGWLVLLGVNVVLGWIPLLGWLLSLVTVYCWVCVSSKRFHDMGKSGWLTVIPIVTGLVLPIVGVIFFGGGLIMAALTGGENDPAAAMSVIGGLLGFMAVLGVAFLISLCFLIWQGVAQGDPGDNAYGPPATVTI